MHALTTLKLLISASLLMCALPASSEGSWKPGDSYTFSVAGSQPQQSIYSVGVAHKQLIEAAIPGININVMATQGGAENVELIILGEANMANANSIAAIAADRETAQFEGQGTKGKVLGFFPGYTSELGAVVLASSDIHTFRDLVGKAIALGPVGSGAEATLTNALKTIGLNDSDFARVQRAAPAQGFSSLASGQVDAVVWGTAHPAGIYLENQSTQNLRFIPFDEADLEKIASDMPGHHAGELRPGTYKGQDQAVQWIGGSTHFWISSEVPEALVYEMVKVLWENREKLVEAHSSQAFIDEALVQQQDGLVRFHPGARRYFVEQGILAD